MKTITQTLAFLILFLPLSVSGQLAQDNLGFENWTSNALGWSVPEGFPISYDAVENTSDPYAGSSALEITSAYSSTFSDTLGIAVNGEIVGGSFVPGEPYTQRPDSVSGFVRTDIPVEDTAAIIFQLTRYDTVGDSTQVIGGASANLPDNVSSWTRVSMPFNYNSAMDPDSILILYTTHNGDQPTHSGAVLEADDFMIHNSTSSLAEKEDEASFEVYPNPSDGRFQVRMDGRFKGSMEIRDLNGRLVHQRSMNGEDRARVRMEDAEKGVYLITLKDTNGERVAMKKVVLTH